MIELKNIDKYYNIGTVNEICLFKDFNLRFKMVILFRYRQQRVRKNVDAEPDLRKSPA